MQSRLSHNQSYVALSPYCMRETFYVQCYWIIVLLAGILLFPLTSNAVQNYNQYPQAFSEATQRQIKRTLHYIKRDYFTSALREARKSRNRDLVDYVVWKTYLDDRYSPDFYELADFITKHEQWPFIQRLQRKAVEAMNEEISLKDKLDWFKRYPPKSGLAQKTLAELYQLRNQQTGQQIYSQQEIISLIRNAWRDGNFEDHQAKEMLKRYGQYFSTADHAARVEQLLWKQRTTQARQVLRHTNLPKAKLYKARIKVILNEYGLDKAIKAVPKADRDDAGLIYDRMQWRLERNREQSALSLLDRLAFTEKTHPYSHQWWSSLNKKIRQLIVDKRYAQAYHLAKHHRQHQSIHQSEAEWLAGWLSLIHLNEPLRAYQHFDRMKEIVSYPISRAKANYWRGRALEAMQQTANAEQAYQQSASHFHTLYGQISRTKVADKQRIQLPNYPTVQAADQQIYARNQLLRVAHLLATSNHYHDTRRFVNQAVNHANTPGEIVYITEFGKKINSPFLSITAAKKALTQDLVLWGGLYPMLNQQHIEHASADLVLSIIRQESLFNQSAVSPVGAIGMMQLMPRTARYTSKKMKIRYSTSRLKKSSHYNIQLGSYYISYLMEKYDQSIVLATAAYNAGEGNVNRWINQYGDPRDMKTIESVLNWIEMIPFSETRNYVQRVIESKQVYSVLLKRQKNGSNGTYTQIFQLADQMV